MVGWRGDDASGRGKRLPASQFVVRGGSIYAGQNGVPGSYGGKFKVAAQNLRRMAVGSEDRRSR